MRFTLVASLVLAFLCGCASKPEGEKNPFVEKTSTINVPAQPKERPGKQDKSDKPDVTPANDLTGKIVLVNDTLRYVVVDFGFGRLPQPEQRLGVYRDGKKVAEIKISEHSRNSNYAADIVTGTVRSGDEVRQ